MLVGRCTTERPTPARLLVRSQGSKRPAVPEKETRDREERPNEVEPKRQRTVETLTGEQADRHPDHDDDTQRDREENGKTPAGVPEDLSA